MNYKNWDGTVEITAQKVLSLSKGAPIKIATWNGYDQNKWFCDVEPVTDPVPSWFLETLSDAWIIRKDKGGRFFHKFFIPCIDCLLVHYEIHTLGKNEYKALYYRINLFPLDPLFSTFRPSLSSGMDTVLGDTWINVDFKDVDNMEIEISSKWRSLDLAEFVKFIETKRWKPSARK